MGFRFQKRIKLAPGLSLNLGKRGASVSIGPRGLKTTIGKRGVKHSVGIPGTGMRYETPYQPIRKRQGERPSEGSKSWRIGENDGPRVAVWKKIKSLFSR